MKLLFVCLLFSSCSLRNFYPTGGAIIGGGLGSLAGPAGGALGAGGGALLGEVARGNESMVEAQETISALTHGDVSALVAKGMEQHQSGFEKFTSTIKNILIVAGILLALYLMIPIFIAKKCSKEEAVKNMTRPPFPPRDL